MLSAALLSNPPRARLSAAAAGFRDAAAVERLSAAATQAHLGVHRGLRIR